MWLRQTTIAMIQCFCPTLSIPRPCIALNFRTFQSVDHIFIVLHIIRIKAQFTACPEWYSSGHMDTRTDDLNNMITINIPTYYIEWKNIYLDKDPIWLTLYLALIIIIFWRSKWAYHNKTLSLIFLSPWITVVMLLWMAEEEYWTWLSDRLQSRGYNIELPSPVRGIVPVH